MNTIRRGIRARLLAFASTVKNDILPRQLTRVHALTYAVLRPVSFLIVRVAPIAVLVGGVYYYWLMGFIEKAAELVRRGVNARASAANAGQAPRPGTGAAKGKAKKSRGQSEAGKSSQGQGKRKARKW